MNLLRRIRLSLAFASICASMVIPSAAQQQQAPPPAPAAPPAPPAQQPPARSQNPFENVPQETTPPPPAQQPPAAPAQQPQLETPKPPEAPVQPSGELVESVEFRGARRVPQDTLKALIVTKAGDVYNEDALRRDLLTLWNTARFDDIKVETEMGRTGLIVRFVVTERRVIRSIDYPGAKSVTVSEILDRFKDRHVGLTVESQYDPNKVQRAAVVLKEFLAERGRQYATVTPVVKQLPPSSLAVSFNVDEGPKVKVGNIDIEGNQAETKRFVIRAMKDTHPIGIPYSIVLEDLFAKTYDAAKLEDDKERVRSAYQDKGYFTAKALDQTITMRRQGGEGWRLPLVKPNHIGIVADIKLPVEEGRLYHLHTMNFVGVKLFRAPQSLVQPLFRMAPGDVFSTAKLRDGLKAMRDLYGSFGYIDFVPEPSFDIPPNSDQIDLTLTADEGKQFFVRRLDFSGNTTTRDKVIRREILIDEGDIFNSHLWDISLLRLNQLGYFEPLKKEDAATINRNPQSNTVDITLKVRERGKNTIGFNGGVSGIAGSFIGLNYSTNNFLGLGETLSINSQLGTIMRSVTFGFTEPYFLDRPIQMGFNVYLTRYDFNQAQQASLLAGYNIAPEFAGLGTQNLLNYVQNGYGFSVSASYQLRRSFARVGITYRDDFSSIVTQTTAATNYFEYINFTGVSGPNALSGIHTSHIIPSYTYNTVNQALNPTGGHSIFFSFDFAGSVLGGNVNTISPTVDLKYFKPSPLNRKHVLAFHATGSMIAGYGGKEAPPFSRSFMGGEQDVRGFDWWSITPVAFIASSVPNVPVLNADGSARTQMTTGPGGVQTPTPVTMSIPIYQLITPGGDTHAVGNFEYRIPIAGPVTLAIFADIGINKILFSNQLKMVQSRVDGLNSQFPQAAFDGRVRIAPGTQDPVASTGLELQVLLPVVQAPFRVYWAYNPLTVREYLQPPIVADRSLFPNAATFASAVAQFGQAYPYFDRRDLFRFTVGRTF
ncbi:MAG TPA: outer membrane protein assembly factor BamA [Bryobacteraceae bacterium]|nr:outer membrane protein assembly factor BamA [Bryobacteraceae bacterium]